MKSYIIVFFLAFSWSGILSSAEYGKYLGSLVNASNKKRIVVQSEWKPGDSSASVIIELIDGGRNVIDSKVICEIEGFHAGVAMTGFSFIERIKDDVFSVAVNLRGGLVKFYLIDVSDGSVRTVGELSLDAEDAIYKLRATTCLSERVVLLGTGGFGTRGFVIDLGDDLGLSYDTFILNDSAYPVMDVVGLGYDKIMLSIYNGKESLISVFDINSGMSIETGVLLTGEIIGFKILNNNTIIISNLDRVDQKINILALSFDEWISSEFDPLSLVDNPLSLISIASVDVDMYMPRTFCIIVKDGGMDVLLKRKDGIVEHRYFRGLDEVNFAILNDAGFTGRGNMSAVYGGVSEGIVLAATVYPFQNREDYMIGKVAYYYLDNENN